MRRSGGVAASTLRPPRSKLGATDVELSLLNSFELRWEGAPVPLPVSAQRLLAFLALHDYAPLRAHVAGMIWLDTPEARAIANLRTTLWRLHQFGCHLVEATSRDVRLAPAVRVDFKEATQLAHRLIGGAADEGDLNADWKPLAGELLPDWYDEWVLMEREHFRQLGLHSLEMLSERLTEARKFGRALEAALAAVAGEPLRESAHRVLIKTHLAEGNASEAIRQYRFYKTLIRDQLGLDPSPAIEALVEGLMIR
jgi:DNA-binding SARP family transcriptional activator